MQGLRVTLYLWELRYLKCPKQPWERLIIIVMISVTNVNMEVAAEKPVRQQRKNKRNFNKEDSRPVL